MGEVYRARDTRLKRDVAIKRTMGASTDMRLVLDWLPEVKRKLPGANR
jgi:hypothetical protein